MRRRLGQQGGQEPWGEAAERATLAVGAPVGAGGKAVNLSPHVAIFKELGADFRILAPNLGYLGILARFRPKPPSLPYTPHMHGTHARYTYKCQWGPITLPYTLTGARTSEGP